jgi:hypothetical protein
LVGLALACSLGACSASKDSLLKPGGTGASPNTGAGGSPGGSSGGASNTGAGGSPASGEGGASSTGVGGSPAGGNGGSTGTGVGGSPAGGNGGSTGAGGQGSVSYVGCRYIGGLDRAVVAKRDTARNLCFNLALVQSTSMQPPAGLSLPPYYVVQSATVGPASACPTMGALPTPATQVVGSVALVSQGVDPSGAADVDVTMTFGSNDAGVPPSEQLSARGVSILQSCIP